MKTVSRPRRFGFDAHAVQTSSFSGVSHSDTSHPVFWTDGVEYGANDPSWKEHIKLGESATTTLSGSVVKVERKKARFVRYLRTKKGDPNPGTVTQRINGSLVSFSVPSASFSASALDRANNQAKIRFIRACSSTQRSLQGLVIAGEIGETLRMLRSPLKSLRDGVGRYLAFLKNKKGRIPPRSKRRFLSETWLEYSYGWRPLLNDIDEAHKLYYAKTRQPIKSRLVVGSGYSEVLDSIHDPWSSLTFGGITYRYSSRKFQSASVRYYGKVWCEPLFKGDFPTSTAIGATLHDFVPSVWNLIPYSFLVDYFTNVGECLEAFYYNSASIRWVTQGTYETNSQESWNEGVTANTDPTFQSRDEGSIGSASISRVRFSRSPYSTNSLTPSLEFRIPGPNSTKWLNIAALVNVHRKIIPF